MVIIKAKYGNKNTNRSTITRKNGSQGFLKYTGTVALGVIGLTGLLRMLLGSRGLNVPPEGSSKPRGSGYGNSSYGK
jgi:hypothetical protein